MRATIKTTGIPTNAPATNDPENICPKIWAIDISLSQPSFVFLLSILITSIHWGIAMKLSPIVPIVYNGASQKYADTPGNSG